MSRKKIIMSWSEQNTFLGTPGANDGLATLFNFCLPNIKDKSTNLEASEGDKLEAYVTGHHKVASESNEGDMSLTMRLIEPGMAVYNYFGLLGGDGQANQPFQVKTHVITKEFSVMVCPKKVGAHGIKVPVASATFKPGYSEEEGHYADLTFDFIQGEQGYWYELFTIAAQDITKVNDYNADGTPKTPTA